MWLKIKDFFVSNEYKIILVLGFIFVAVISFEAGVMKGAKISQKPVIVEQKEAFLAENNNSNQKETAPIAQNLLSEASKNQNSSNIPAQNCAFLGSKNSNKYHLPTCRWAKNIKTENRVCFASVDDANQKGYQPDKNCIK